jgi:hypothetical protein
MMRAKGFQQKTQQTGYSTHPPWSSAALASSLAIFVKVDYVWSSRYKGLVPIVSDLLCPPQCPE